MNLQLIRQGLVFCPSGEPSWMTSHAQVPRLIEHAAESEILFATRSPPDTDGRFVSRIGSVRVHKSDPTAILSVSSTPVLDVGGAGQFDEFGVMPGCVIRHNGTERLYYTGWSRPNDAPYQTFIGVAERNETGDFVRIQESPALGVTKAEPILCNGPFIIESADMLHMFYASALRWIDHEGRRECEYKIAHATSTDGLNWNRDGTFVVPTKLQDECQNAPTVIRINNRFHMWFCYRDALDFRNQKRGYRLGYAWSDDLNTWHRNDGHAKLTGPAQHWESEMQCYPGVFNVDERWLMFYCGNYFGRSGFGYAELQAHEFSNNDETNANHD